MDVYISLLRGINVGGNKIIPMADLRWLFEKMGFTGVGTYIQSGNVVFTSARRKPFQLEKEITEGIKRTFQLDVRNIVLSLEELERTVSENPFGKDKLNRGGRIYFTLLMESPLKKRLIELEKLKKDSAIAGNTGDNFAVVGRTIYILCRNGWSKSAFNSSATEKILKVDTTSRNLDTMQKLLEMGLKIKST